MVFPSLHIAPFWCPLSQKTHDKKIEKHVVVRERGCICEHSVRLLAWSSLGPRRRQLCQGSGFSTAQIVGARLRRTILGRDRLVVGRHSKHGVDMLQKNRTNMAASSSTNRGSPSVHSQRPWPKKKPWATNTSTEPCRRGLSGRVASPRTRNNDVCGLCVVWWVVVG